jgi:hypothetical protein
VASVRLLPALCVLFFLAAPTLAADGSVQAQREYIDRVLALDDTVAAHIALARWCEANGLMDRARQHWQAVVRRDADNKEARAALGFVRRGTEWVPASQTSALPAELPPTTVVATPPSPAKRRGLAQEVQAIVVSYLGSADPRVQENGRDLILMMRDPEAAEPIFRILGAGSVEMRQLACEALGRIPGEDAGKYLVKFLLIDPSEDVFLAAVAALASRDQDRGVPMLVNALNGSGKAMARAVFALGEMREWRAVPALIGHLKMQEPRIVTSIVTHPRPSMFSGTLIPYVANVTPIVANGVVAWKPTIGYVGSGIGFADSTPEVVQRTVYELVPQPAVREALRKITGQDCEFRTQDWWKLWDKRRVDTAPTLAPPPSEAPPPPQ